MKYAVISDIHSNIEALTAVLESIEKQSVDDILCCGDLVGYYTNPNECIELVRANRVRSVIGNHDIGAASIREIKCWYVAERAIRWTQGRLTAESVAALRALPSTLVVNDQLLLFHGALHPEQHPEDLHLYTPEDVEKSLIALTRHPSRVRLAFFGHTHVAVTYSYRDGRLTRHEDGQATLRDDTHYLINPGSVGQPRDGDPRASYAIYDATTNRIEFHRVAYDVASCRRKAKREGLLPDHPLKTLGKRAYRKALRMLGTLRQST